MNKRIKKKKSHPLLNPVMVAYIVATKINTQCPGFASDFKLTHRKLKRCLMYHYHIFKHNRKSLSHLYYTEQTLNKRYYSTATFQLAPRIHDGRIISVDLCKEEN
jgi:hypothetical protein